MDITTTEIAERLKQSFKEVQSLTNNNELPGLWHLITNGLVSAVINYRGLELVVMCITFDTPELIAKDQASYHRVVKILGVEESFISYF
jgi:hypothetical protein